jgi:hypothetical protein
MPPGFLIYGMSVEEFYGPTLRVVRDPRKNAHLQHLRSQFPEQFSRYHRCDVTLGSRVDCSERMFFV